MPTGSRFWRGFGPRIRSGASATKPALAGVVVIVLLLAGCASGSTASGTVPLSAGASAPAPSGTATQTTSVTASPIVSAEDGDDETGASAGASFAPNATGILPTPGGGSADRLPGEPDAGLTPGALNPAVTQVTIHSTICVSGWTATIRPSESFTNALKIKQIGQYSYSDAKTSSYEEDHLISLELGGAPADARNLWPEPYTASLADGRPTGAHTKDAFETELKTEVCAGTITLAQGQGEIGDHWVHAYYGIAPASSVASPATTAAPTPTATPTANVTAPPETPVVTAPAASLSVSITALPASVTHGANATLGALTSPGATCSASVTYASGTVSSAAGLQTHPVADSSGTVSWTWKVGSSTRPGTANAHVTCSLSGDSAGAGKDFAVT